MRTSRRGCPTGTRAASRPKSILGRGAYLGGNEQDRRHGSFIWSETTHTQLAIPSRAKPHIRELRHSSRTQSVQVLSSSQSSLLRALRVPLLRSFVCIDRRSAHAPVRRLRVRIVAMIASSRATAASSGIDAADAIASTTPDVAIVDSAPLSEEAGDLSDSVASAGQHSMRATAPFTESTCIVSHTSTPSASESSTAPMQDASECKACKVKGHKILHTCSKRRSAPDASTSLGSTRAKRTRTSRPMLALAEPATTMPSAGQTDVLWQK